MGAGESEGVRGSGCEGVSVSVSAPVSVPGMCLCCVCACVCAWYVPVSVPSRPCAFLRIVIGKVGRRAEHEPGAVGNSMSMSE